MPKQKHEIDPNAPATTELKLEPAESKKTTPVLERDLPMVDAKGQRLSLALTEKGDLDLERTRSTGIDKLKKALSNPQTKIELGLTKQDIVEEKDAKRILEMLGEIESLSATWLMRIDPRIVEQVIPFDERELKVLAPPLKDVLNKHVDKIPAYLKWKDEIALVSQLAMIEYSKFNLLKQMQKEFNKSGKIPMMDDGVMVLRVPEPTTPKTVAVKPLAVPEV